LMHRGWENRWIGTEKGLGIEVNEDSLVVAGNTLHIGYVATVFNSIAKVVRDKNVINAVASALIRDDGVVMELWRKVWVTLMKNVYEPRFSECLPKIGLDSSHKTSFASSMMMSL